MSRLNKLVQAPPFPVERTLLSLGEKLRRARLRRNMTVAQAGERIGTGPRAVMDAEKGKPSTGIIVYAALLWLYDLLGELDQVAEPFRDTEGLALESARARRRARQSKGADNDF